MSLQSKLFAGDSAFEKCAVNDAAHIVPGTKGAHVGKLHTALFAIDGLAIAPRELAQDFYGPSTAGAVLAFKRQRNIVNRAYQSKADDIVGRMTIAALDAAMRIVEMRPVIADRRTFAWTTRRG